MNAHNVQRAEQLRMAGMSYRQIERELGICSTAVRWLLSDEARAAGNEYCRQYRIRRKEPDYQPAPREVRVYRPALMRSIMEESATRYKLQPRDLIEQSRFHHITLARHIAFYLMREDAGASYSAIGRFMDRDHSAIINGCRRIARLIAEDEELARHVEAIRRSVNERRAAA